MSSFTVFCHYFQNKRVLVEEEETPTGRFSGSLNLFTFFFFFKLKICTLIVVGIIYLFMGHLTYIG